jgi:beta-galactosidase
MELKFPKGFSWGTAISAFQTEMGSSEASNFGGTDWFEWTNSEEIIKEGLVSGDKPQEGDGFWDLYEEDMRLAKSLGNDSLRMSIEWARIFSDDTSAVDGQFKRNEKGEPLSFSPTGTTLSQLKSTANRDALDHYKKMIDYAHSIGLKVFMTLYHWPLPLWLHRPVKCHRDLDNAKERGWLDIKTVEEFAKYSYFVSETLGTKVDAWETINEPEVIATNGYVFGKSAGFPPGLENIPLAFRVERNLAFAHNLGFRTLKKYTGKEVGIGTAPPYFEPVTGGEKDREVANTARYLNNEWILNAALRGEFDNNLSGTPDEKIANFGGSDYIGIDYYTRMRVEYSEEELYAGALPMKVLPCEDCNDFKWDIYAEGMRPVLKWIYDRFQLPLYILENGIADSNDQKRKRYIVDHLKALQEAIEIDKVPVKGYFHWTLFDNFEWASGYSMKFGLYEVDYRTKERRKRNSAETYERICKGLPID